jgi:hypothetical protein
MSTPNSQNAMRAALAARPPRQPLIWPTGDQMLRALRKHDSRVVRILFDDLTFLGLAICRNLSGWTSKQFKLNSPEQLAFDGVLVPIQPPEPSPAGPRP